jgi:hypothetical protein
VIIRAMQNGWKTPQLVVVKKGKYQDFPILGGGIPVFGGRAYGVLGDTLKNDVEYLDITVINYDVEYSN